MADWDRAAERLKKKKQPARRGVVQLSASATRAAKEQRKLQEERAARRAQMEAEQVRMQQYWEGCERKYVDTWWSLLVVRV